jgi:predicted RNA binding protein YcfA (HicA-like mRNA interferase family)
MKVGFKPVRKKGSHIILKHGVGRVAVIPVHKGEEGSRGLLTRLLKRRV